VYTLDNCISIIIGATGSALMTFLSTLVQLGQHL